MIWLIWAISSIPLLTSYSNIMARVVRMAHIAHTSDLHLAGVQPLVLSGTIQLTEYALFRHTTMSSTYPWSCDNKISYAGRRVPAYKFLGHVGIPGQLQGSPSFLQIARESKLSPFCLRLT
jgi:hypothetical protein